MNISVEKGLRTAMIAFVFVLALAILFSINNEDVDGAGIDTTENDITYTVFGYDDFATVTGYGYGIVDVEIPPEVIIDGISYPVKTIAENAFWNCTTLKIISAMNVTNIEHYAFDACSSLETVSLGNVIEIGDGVFYDCTSLKSITFGKDSEIEMISGFMFYHCPSLISVIIPDSVKAIGGSAFEGCSSLTSVSMKNVESIYVDAFAGCTSIASVDLPESVTVMGYGVFRDCASLESINVPKDVTAIGGSTFRNCVSLKTVSLPDGLAVIGGYAFFNCGLLSAIDIPHEIRSIRNGAFRDCISLGSIEIPDGIAYLGEYAFLDCTSLRSVVMPNNVGTVGMGVFQGCTNLEKMTISGEGSGNNSILDTYFSADVWRIEHSNTITELVIDTSDEIDIDNVNIVKGNVLTITYGSESVFGANGRLIFEDEAVSGKDRAGKTYTGDGKLWNGVALPHKEGSFDIGLVAVILVLSVVLIMVGTISVVRKEK